MRQLRGYWQQLAGMFAAVVVLAGALVFAAAGASAAATVSASNMVVTMFSAPGDFIGGGISREFDATNASISGTAASTGLSLSVNGGTVDTSWTFLVDPPRGAAFRPGYYSGVQQAEFRSGKHPGLDISGNGHGCNADTGSFDVRDLATSGPKIIRLDLLYTQYCDAGPGALFGEIRIGEPEPGSLLVSSSSITWPPTGAGGRTTVPVYVRNRGSKPVPVGKAALTGYAAGDFRLAADACSGKTLGPGSSCALSVGFASSTPGPRTASLQIRLGTALDKVQLDAPVPVGATSLTMTSQHGDFVGQGKSWNYTASNAGFYFVASPAGLTAYVWVDGGWLWNAELTSASGHRLAVGNYPAVSITGPGNVLDVAGDSRGCNTVTGSFQIKQVTFSGQSLEHLDATFSQHCEGASPALNGEIKYVSAPVLAPLPAATRVTAIRSRQGVRLTWKNPAISRYHYTMVRVEPASPVGVAPSAGVAAYSGTGHSTTVTGLVAGRKYTIVVYTVDRYGNVSAPSERVITG
jgi:hypothetical protein